MLTVNGTLAALLREVGNDRQPGAVMGITQPEVNAYSRMLVRGQTDTEYKDALLSHNRFGPAIGKFTQMMMREQVVPLDAWQELKAVEWLVHNRNIIHLGHREQTVLLNSPRFCLVDFRLVPHGAITWVCSPVWRAKSITGKGQFDYCPWPWQSGMRPQLV